jgi:hypothetical protein
MGNQLEKGKELRKEKKSKESKIFNFMARKL